MKRTGRIVLTLVVLAGAAGAAWWYLYAPSQAKTAPQTVAVSRGNVETTVLASGVLEASSLVSSLTGIPECTNAAS